MKTIDIFGFGPLIDVNKKVCFIGMSINMRSERDYTYELFLIAQEYFLYKHLEFFILIGCQYTIIYEHPKTLVHILLTLCQEESS